MVNKKRQSNEILLNVLEVLHRREKVKTTHILVKANLSTLMLSAILEDLIQREAVTYEYFKDTRYYSLTTKGIKMFYLIKQSIELYNEAMKL